MITRIENRLGLYFFYNIQIYNKKIYINNENGKLIARNGKIIYA